MYLSQELHSSAFFSLHYTPHEYETKSKTRDNNWFSTLFAYFFFFFTYFSCIIHYRIFAKLVHTILPSISIFFYSFYHEKKNLTFQCKSTPWSWCNKIFFKCLKHITGLVSSTNMAKPIYHFFVFSKSVIFLFFSHCYK